MRNTKGSITNLSCLLTEDRTEKSFLGRKLRLALGSNFTYKDIARADLCSDTDDSAVVKIL